MSKKMRAIKRKRFEALRQRYIDEWGYHPVTAKNSPTKLCMAIKHLHGLAVYTTARGSKPQGAFVATL